MRRPLAAVLLALLVAGCSSPVATPPDVTEAPSAGASADPSSGATRAIVPDSPVAGVVIAVDARGLNDVRGFTLRTNTGEIVEFELGELENGDEFPPGHLTEHQAAAAPVLVFFREEGSRLVVHRIEDAG